MSKISKPLSLADLDRISKLEDLDRMMTKIRDIESQSASVKNPEKHMEPFRIVSEESFQWLIELATNKHDVMLAAVQAEYPDEP
jgi:hypothetical protein